MGVNLARKMNRAHKKEKSMVGTNGVPPANGPVASIQVVMMANGEVKTMHSNGTHVALLLGMLSIASSSIAAQLHTKSDSPIEVAPVGMHVPRTD